MNHTQGKLEIENDMGDSWLLVDENGYVVARDNTVNTDNNPELSKANAQHLKRCWNNHDELLKCAYILSELECVADTEGESGCNHCIGINAIANAEKGAR